MHAYHLGCVVSVVRKSQWGHNQADGNKYGR